MTPAAPPRMKPLIALIAMVVRNREDKLLCKPNHPDPSDVTNLITDLIGRLKREVDTEARKKVGEGWDSERHAAAIPWNILRRSVLFSDSIQLSVGVHGGKRSSKNSATLKSSTRLSQLWKDLVRFENETWVTQNTDGSKVTHKYRRHHSRRPLKDRLSVSNVPVLASTLVPETTADPIANGAMVRSGLLLRQFSKNLSNIIVHCRSLFHFSSYL